MSIFDPAPAPWPSRMLSIFRIVAGVLFISFGTLKLFGYPPMPPMPPGTPAPVITVMSQTWIAGVLEFVGGILIVLGLFTRPVAFILSGEMAVAYFQFHYPLSFFPTTNNGTPAIMFCWFFLYLAFAGAGVWSVDESIARRRRAGYVSQG
jgi:putative oxidoreductase